MLAQVFLVVIATCGVAFLVHFEIMLLRELKQRVLIMSLTETDLRARNQTVQKSLAIGDILCEKQIFVATTIRFSQFPIAYGYFFEHAK